MKLQHLIIILIISMFSSFCSKKKELIENDIVLQNLGKLTESEKVIVKFNNCLFEHYNTSSKSIQDTITIRNLGLKPFKIWKIHHSCSCTEINLTDSIILPRHTLQIPISIDISNEIGFFSKKLIIYGNMHSTARVFYFEGIKE